MESPASSSTRPRPETTGLTLGVPRRPPLAGKEGIDRVVDEAAAEVGVLPQHAVPSEPQALDEPDRCDVHGIDEGLDAMQAHLLESVGEDGLHRLRHDPLAA